MKEITVNCPFCEDDFLVGEEFSNQVVNCPHCNEEVYVEAKPQLKKMTRKEYKTIMTEGIQDLEEQLNMHGHHGWRPVTMTTIFLSETTGGVGGFSSGQKREGLVVILEKEATYYVKS